MQKRILLLALFCCLVPGVSWGQQKFEKETRIKPSKVPGPAQQFIAAIPFPRKVKWYQEENLSSSSFEAKTRYNKHKYSIEFDTDGELQDVEIKIKWAAVPELTKTAIQEYLKKTFDQFRYSKIQEQLSGETAAIINHLLGEEKKETITTQYEIVLKGKKAGQTSWFEYTFDAQGKFKDQKTIIFRNTDNLEY